MALEGACDGIKERLLIDHVQLGIHSGKQGGRLGSHCLGIGIINPWRDNFPLKAWYHTQPGHQMLVPFPGEDSGGNMAIHSTFFFAKKITFTHLHEILSKAQKTSNSTHPAAPGSHFHGQLPPTSSNRAFISIRASNSLISWCGGLGSFLKQGASKRERKTIYTTPLVNMAVKNGPGMKMYILLMERILNHLG